MLELLDGKVRLSENPDLATKRHSFFQIDMSISLLELTGFDSVTIAIVLLLFALLHLVLRVSNHTDLLAVFQFLRRNTATCSPPTLVFAS